MAKTKTEEKIEAGATRPIDPLNIPLGTEVFEALTQVQGIVTQRAEQISGNIRYAVQPPGDGSHVPEALMVDWHTLLVVGPGYSAVASKVTSRTDIKLGEEVEHSVNGMRGIAVEKTVFMNGCEFLEVHGKIDKEHPQGSIVCDSSFLWKKIGNGLGLQDVGNEEAVQAAKDKPPGGPMTRIRPGRARFVRFATGLQVDFDR